MSFNLDRSVVQPIQILIEYKQSEMVSVSSNSALIDHFLAKVKMSQARLTWINYAHDLKVFFRTIQQPLEAVNRQSCVRFMEAQALAGLSSLTINRRLAAISSLFMELNLIDPERFLQNPVTPLRLKKGTRQKSLSLYRRQPQRVPDVIAEEDLQAFFTVLPTWRDRTLILLMWVSCLRISEAVSIGFADIECSNRSIRIRHGKGSLERVIYMDRYTFAALNKYLDDERRDLYPDVDSVFVSFKGGAGGSPLSVNALQHTIDYYATKVGLSLHAHLFRHTGITSLVVQGMSEAAIRQLVGHRNATSLEPYLHLSDRFVEGEFAKAQSALGSASFLSLPEGGQQL